MGVKGVKTWVLLLVLLIPGYSSGKGGDLGLSFRSHETNKEERTSLDLTAVKELKLGDYLCLEFDAKVRPKSENYGYIARIWIGEDDRIEVMLNNFPYPHLHYQLLYNKTILSQRSRENNTLDFFNWSKFKIELTQTDSGYTIHENGRVVAQDIKLPRNQPVRIIFGADYTSRQTTCDVAPMIVRNITVRLKPGQVKYAWPLHTYCKDGYAYDTLHNHPARVANPDWQIDSHTRWRRTAGIDFDSKVFFVKGQGTVSYFITRNTVCEYDFACDSITARHSFSPELPVKLIKNQFIYDAPRHRILLYDFDRKQHPAIWFDFESEKWSQEYTRRNNYTYLHHNKFFSPVDSSLFQLFGYGLHRYRSNVYRMNPDGSVTHTDWSDSIQPRYLSATAVADTLLYIYGGMGNQTGKQEYGAEIFNDLYRVNLRTLSVEKMWAHETTGESEVGASSLLIDPEGKKATGLFFCPNRYSTSLQLKEMDLQDGQFRALADTIPYPFLDTGSEADLKEIPKLGRMFAVVSHRIDESHYRAEIYAVSTPVFSPSEAIYATPSRPGAATAAIIAGILATAAAGCVYLRRKSKTKHPVQAIQAPHDSQTENTATLERRRTQPGIYLLGNFQVIDRQGRDITSEFSPTLKQILILIILYTEKNGKGVSNARLKEYLWYDKTEQSTRNNRNVNMRKLRMLLETVGEFGITTDNSYWKIEYGAQQALCDWTQATEYLRKMSTEPTLAAQGLPAIIHTAQQGALLPNTSFEWLDPFKAAYSDLVMGLLGAMRHSAPLSASPEAQLQLSDAVLGFDSLDEESMRIKCISLISLGRIGTAKKSFDSFIREYRLVMGEEYPDSFEKFIQTP